MKGITFQSPKNWPPSFQGRWTITTEPQSDIWGRPFILADQVGKKTAGALRKNQVIHVCDLPKGVK